MSEQFVGLGNKKLLDHHRLKVGRGFLRGLHKRYSIGYMICLAKSYSQSQE